jgi:hypothetical protein
MGRGIRKDGDDVRVGSDSNEIQQLGGADNTVRESSMSDLDDLLVLLSCQLDAPRHRKLGRTVETRQTQTHDLVTGRSHSAPCDTRHY